MEVIIKWIKSRWFIIIFVLTLFLSVYGGILDRGIELGGVVAEADKVEFTLETVNEGKYQIYLNEVWERGFKGKKSLLRVRNQILYSLCKVSPNSNVILGKDKYLYEPIYILYETQAFAPCDEEYFTVLGENLLYLKQFLEKNNKELYVFITPSKAHFYREYIPDKYMLLGNEGMYKYTNYSKLLEVLEKKEINYYDSINFITESYEKGNLKSPVFYKSANHWSHAWGQSAASDFLKYINSQSKYNISVTNVQEVSSDYPIYPDADLYESLNLLFDADETWYNAETIVEVEGSDYPNVFLRGGSFMGQSLSALIVSGVFGEDVHLENNYYFTNQYTSTEFISDYMAYDEIDLDTMMGKSDILIIEVNEGAIPVMGFGFIEYLLEHTEFLDRDF